MTWAFLTGEYPPQPGGVSDYTRLVARGLADAGEEVHVWAPATALTPCEDPGVNVHRLPGHFGPQGLRLLDADLDRLPAPRRLLVEYVPHAFGWKAMNVPFCLWLSSRRRDSIWSMFHEVAFPLAWNQRLSHNVLGAVTNGMARLVARASERIFYSTTAWLPRLEGFASAATKTWLPIPSNMPEAVEPAAVAAVRERLMRNPASCVIGHFGTYTPRSQELLLQVVAPILQADDKTLALFAGRGSAPFKDRFVTRHPATAQQVYAIETDCAQTLAAHLAACDVMVQGYPDGVTTRRSSLMASLALGKAIVTNCGHLTEPLWQESDAVALVPGWSAESMRNQVQELLRNQPRRAQLGARAAVFYADRFALSRSLKVLLSQT